MPKCINITSSQTALKQHVSYQGNEMSFPVTGNSVMKKVFTMSHIYFLQHCGLFIYILTVILTTHFQWGEIIRGRNVLVHLPHWKDASKVKQYMIWDLYYRYNVIYFKSSTYLQKYQNKSVMIFFLFAILQILTEIKKWLSCKCCTTLMCW